MKINKIYLRSVILTALAIIVIGSSQSRAAAESSLQTGINQQKSFIGNLQGNRQATISSGNPMSSSQAAPITAQHKYFLPAVNDQSSIDPVVLAAGDIAECPSMGDMQTAELLRKVQATILTLGDNAYDSGTLAEFNTCYNPSWGPFKSETYPAVGNHEYLTPGAAGYFQYYGSVAGDPTKGYYSYNLGTWHIVVLNSNCDQVGGCDLGSPQVTWLQADLAAHPTVCTLAYWHQPRFSSGEHGDNTRVSAFWQVLYQAGADVILNGHDHDYERFAPQDPNAVANSSHGITEFVVGTGGKNLRTITATTNNSVVHNDTTWGVLELVLHPTSYYWQFIPVSGGTFTDSGTAQCH